MSNQNKKTNDDLQTCEACNQKFEIESMRLTEDNWFCQECDQKLSTPPDLENLCFVRVGASYTAKNKLAKNIYEAMKEYDNVLFMSGPGVATKTLTAVFNNTCQKYYQKENGKAKMPNQSIYETDNGFGFKVEDVIVLIGDVVKEVID